MKVKIKKQGKKETYNLIESWSDVTLDRWQLLIDADKGSKSKEAQQTITAMSDIPKKLVNELALKDVALIAEKLAELQVEQDSELVKIIKMDGVEYAFHPNLDELTLGEYADIESFIKQGYLENLPQIMAVLFRPIKEWGENGVYTIKAYDGDIAIRAEIMKKMSAEQVQSALRFFFALGTEFLKILPSCLMERTQEIMKEIQEMDSRNAGDGLE
tara:strand:- start:535 stop:1179 length:645 start_codon:yes stop_codon:yes gene_type:complete